MKERRQPTRREWAAITSRRPVVRRIPNVKTKPECEESNRYYHRTNFEPESGLSKPHPEGSERFDNGSTEPAEWGTSGQGSGGSLPTGERTTEPGAEPGNYDQLVAARMRGLEREFDGERNGHRKGHRRDCLCEECLP